MDIKPIETYYRGCHFRSRIEARWAVFYDYLGLDWRHEPEGYNLNGILYLPDYYIPGIGFIEIKGAEPTKEETRKCELLSNIEKTYLFFGDIPESPADCFDTSSAYWFMNGAQMDCCYHWCICPVCRKVGIQYEGRASRNCDCVDGDKGYNFEDVLLSMAYMKARSARFEHGQ